MPFKVVQTLEGKKYKLFTVPSGWETNNILRYPNKCISKYIKDENSTPTLDWDVMKCTVKRSNVLSYAIGDELISEMLKHSDTEEDIDNYSQRRRPQNKKTLNLNEMAQDMKSNIVLNNLNKDAASSCADLPMEFNYNVAYNIEEIDTTPLVQDPPLAVFDINKMFELQKQITDNQATIVNQIIQNQQQQQDFNSTIIAQMQSLNNAQTHLIQKVAALSVQLEDAVSQIISSSDQDVVPLNSIKGHVDNNPINVKPVDSVQDLDELEEQLSIPNYRDRLKNTYAVLCSGGKAIDCAYLLVDIMFTRKFVCECSWSGGSRGENMKIPLKGYKQVLSFFWNMVHYWDQTYSLKDNEIFFKTILKNAKKRKMAKFERASTSRQRSKPKNNLKRMKLSEENVTHEVCDGESENEINKEENTMDDKEINDLLEKNTKENIEDVIKNSNVVGKETSV